MGQKHRIRNVVEVKMTKRQQAISQLVDAGFDPAQFTEFQIAMMVQVGTLKSEIVEAIDTMGSMLEDVLGDD